MRKIMLIMMLLLSVSMVFAARPPTDVEPIGTPNATASDFVIDNDGFGEKPSFIDTVGDFFRRVFNPGDYAFTSQYPDIGNPDEFNSYYYDGGLKTATDSYEPACDSCNEGDFCQLLRYDPVTYEYWGPLFADLWYVSYPGDSINLASSQWYTSTIEIYYGYKCYEPKNTPIIYSCREYDGPQARIYEDGSIQTTCNIADCKVSDKTVNDKLTIAEMESTFCNRLDICYTCDGSQLIQEVQDGCQSGWSTTKPDCQVQTNDVLCYQCDGLDVKNRIFQDSCGTGWSTTAPNCEPVIEPTNVVCYQCNSGQVATRTFVDSCDAGWSTERPSVCQITCYQCDGENIASKQYDDGCPTGWVPQKPTSCQGEQVQCYSCQQGGTGVVLSKFDTQCVTPWTDQQLTKSDCLEGGCDFICKATTYFKENSPESYVIAVSAIILLVVLLSIIFGGKKSKTVTL